MKFYFYFLYNYVVSFLILPERVSPSGFSVPHDFPVKITLLSFRLKLRGFAFGHGVSEEYLRHWSKPLFPVFFTIVPLFQLFSTITSTIKNITRGGSNALSSAPVKGGFYAKYIRLAKVL